MTTHYARCQVDARHRMSDTLKTALAYAVSLVALAVIVASEVLGWPLTTGTIGMLGGLVTAGPAWLAKSPRRGAP